jgi:hypothetical protein
MKKILVIEACIYCKYHLEGERHTCSLKKTSIGHYRIINIDVYNQIPHWCVLNDYAGDIKNNLHYKK